MITDLIKTQSFYTFISNKNRLINTITMSCSTEYTYSKGDAVLTHTQDQIIEKPAQKPSVSFGGMVTAPVSAQSERVRCVLTGQGGILIAAFLFSFLHISHGS